MLPVIISPAENEPVLGPDDLRPDGKTGGGQAFGDGRGMQRAMPDIGHIAGKQRPGRAPVGTIVVQHLAGPFGLGRARLVAPGWVIFHAIGRIGHHQERLHIAQQPSDHIGGCAVAADQTVRSQLPDVTGN